MFVFCITIPAFSCKAWRKKCLKKIRIAFLYARFKIKRNICCPWYDKLEIIIIKCISKTLVLDLFTLRGGTPRVYTQNLIKVYSLSACHTRFTRKRLNHLSPFGKKVWSVKPFTYSKWCHFVLGLKGSETGCNIFFSRNVVMCDIK